MNSSDRETMIIENKAKENEKKNNFTFAVITPVKNEAEFIEQTIHSMIHQVVKPAVWVIVNDGSQDETERIVQKYVEEYAWIKLYNRMGNIVRKRGKGVVEAFYFGFNTLDLEYDFIVKMDGDVTFDPYYFESLLLQFDLDPQLGIAGGGLYEKPYGKTWVLLTFKDHVRGCTKIYRQKCFNEIGGLVPSMGWDGIDEWNAMAKGWKIQSFLNVKIYHHRYTGAATGYLKSWIEQGDGAFRMGYHPLFLFARGIRCMTERPYFIGGLAMMASYILSWLRGEEYLAEPYVVNYIRKTQMKKLIGLLAGKPVHS